MKLLLAFLAIILLLSATFSGVAAFFIGSRVLAEAQSRVDSDLNSAQEIYGGYADGLYDVIRLSADRFYLRDALLSEAIACQREAEENGEDFAEDWQSRVVEEMTTALPRIDGRAMASLAWMYARGRNPSRRPSPPAALGCGGALDHLDGHIFQVQPVSGTGLAPV